MRYKPLGAKVEIDAETALLQAVAALDAAAETAEKTNDVEGLLNTAAMWMRMSGTIGNFQVEEAESAAAIIKANTQLRTGFQAAEITVEEDDDE